ncbi:MAG: histidinol dehydrogenase [Candidatus Hodgkinia cicadicola]
MTYLNTEVISVGYNTLTALGDYINSTNQVSPTSSAVHLSLGLNVLDFMDKSTFVWTSTKRSLTYLISFYIRPY